jgi:hypothetical protein
MRRDNQFIPKITSMTSRVRVTNSKRTVRQNWNPCESLPKQSTNVSFFVSSKKYYYHTNIWLWPQKYKIATHFTFLNHNHYSLVIIIIINTFYLFIYFSSKVKISSKHLVITIPCSILSAHIPMYSTSSCSSSFHSYFIF